MNQCKHKSLGKGGVKNDFVYAETGRIFKKKKKMGFTPCKTEEPLQGIELQEKEVQKD